MNYLIADVETYWDNDYTLSKMTTDEYVHDPRFAVHGWGVRFIGGKYRWLDDAQFRRFAAVVDWSDTAIIGHHLHFDGLILSHHYGVRPKLWIDTLSMSRAIWPRLVSHSLSNIAKFLGLSTQKGAYVIQTKGLRVLTAAQHAELGAYCADDVTITEELFNRLYPNVPPEERMHVDATIRMFTEPSMVGDSNALATFLDEQRLAAATRLERLDVTVEQLRSDEQLAMLLRQEGVDPPTKYSVKQKKLVYAFARTDQEFINLSEHDNERVQELVTARLGAKSTIFESRTERIMDASLRGPLRVHVNYWGARVTGRDSGGGKTNYQNIPARTAPGKRLRRTIKALPGHKLVVGDSANIELRGAMYLAQETEELQRIAFYDTEHARGNHLDRDVYCEFGDRIFGRTIHKHDTDERFTAKTGKLSLQYGAGADKFYLMLRSQGQKNADPSLAQNVVNVYRSTYRKMQELWRYHDRVVIPAMASGNSFVRVDFAELCLTTGNGFVIPGRLGVDYGPITMVDSRWQYMNGRFPALLYGPKLTENECQHISRHVVFWQAALFMLRYPLALRVHDELVACVPEEEAEACAHYMLRCLRTTPPWAAGLPVNGEVGIGDNYGDAKP